MNKIKEKCILPNLILIALITIFIFSLINFAYEGGLKEGIEEGIKEGYKEGLKVGMNCENIYTITWEYDLGYGYVNTTTKHCLDGMFEEATWPINWSAEDDYSTGIIVFNATATENNDLTGICLGDNCVRGGEDD